MIYLHNTWLLFTALIHPIDINGLISRNQILVPIVGFWLYFLFKVRKA